MTKAITVRLDEKGRLQLPQKVRLALQAKPGDVFFVQLDDGDSVRMMRASNPFDILAEQALDDHRHGKTVPLDKIIAENETAREPE